MSLELGSTLLGSFISLLLIVNAYFTRKTLEKVTEIEVELREKTVKQEYIERQSNEDHAEILKLRDRVHSLEGAQKQIIAFIDDYNNG